MLRILFLLFLLVPLVEVYLFIRVGSLIGPLATVAICILTAVTGSFLVRAQGTQTIRRVQEKLRIGEPPAIDLVEGFLLLMAGLLLMTPGFFTDIAGMLCLVPSIRTRIAMLAIRRMIVSGPVRSDTTGVIIEGEFREEQDPRLR